MGRRQEIQWFVLALLLNLVLALVYLLVTRLHHKELRRDCLIRFFVMLLCPVVAEIYFFFSWIYFRVFFHREVDLADVIFSKEREKTYRKAQESTESNLVPLEEALAVTDRTSTRVLMMDVIRRDISGTLKTISLSLDSDDSEVSHYGASILQSTLSDFRKQVTQLYDAIRKSEDTDADVTPYERELIEDLDAVLRQHVLSDEEQKEFTDMMDKAARLLYKKGAQLSADELEKLCSRLLDIGDTGRCREWADLSDRLWPGELSTYTNYLRLYYRTGETEKFFERLEALKASEITIDHRTLEVIRLFQEPETKEEKQ